MAAAVHGVVRAATLAAIILSSTLCGCAGINNSSRPIYPEDWPSLAQPGSGRECPDLSGTYLARSDEAPPLVYPDGGQPSRMVLLVPYGAPIPAPALGRRVLTWHLAGMRAELRGSSVKAGISPEDYDAKWDALAHYAALVEAQEVDPDGRARPGVVRIREANEGVVEVDARLGDQTILDLRLKKRSPDVWTYQNASYECRDGGLSITGFFVPPDVEKHMGLRSIASVATFYRTVDGSLVMLEQSPVGIGEDITKAFAKWWRWRPLQQ